MWSPLTSSGQSADVGADSERWTDGLQSASLSHGRVGCGWFRPDSEHAAMEVSLWEARRLGWVRVTESTKYIFVLLCLQLPSPPPQKKQKLEPIPITDQPSEHVYLFNSSSLLSVSLSLYCVSELGVKQDYSLAVSACRMVFDYNFYFPFLGKKENKDKEITVPTKMISTYQESCRTSYTSFYCITVSLRDSRSFKGIVFNGRQRVYRVRQCRSHMYSAV